MTNANQIDTEIPIQKLEEPVPEKPKKKEPDNTKREITYLVDKEIEVRFFKIPKFVEYFIHHIKQESIPIHIEIKEMSPEEANDSSLNYTIKLIGTKQEIRIVRKFIKHLLESIKTKKYEQKNIPNWSSRSKPIEIIQNTLDQTTQLFTLCELHWRTIKMYYFDDEKFNSPRSIIDIDQALQNQIVQQNILWSFVDNQHTIEFFVLNTRQISSTYRICPTEQFSTEFDEIRNQDSSFVSITVNGSRKKSIEIFGYKVLVEEISEKFNILFDKYRLRKFKLNQFSSTEVCLYKSFDHSYL